MFPPLHQADDPQFHNPILQHPLLADAWLPLPTLDGEMVPVPEHLLPLSEDLDTDTLPMEQHPSYPFGNPFFIHHTPHTLQPAGSSQPKLDPRTHSRLSMHAASDMAREDVLMSVATGSASAHAAIEAKNNPLESDKEGFTGTPSYTLHPDGSVHLAPHLQMRAQVTTLPKTPVWPFRRFGPGPSARPYASLFRVPWPGETTPEVSVWSDFALEALVPRPRPDSYTLPSSLKHPYAQGAPRATHPTGRRARPSEIPPTLGAETAAIDHWWLDDASDRSAASDYEDETGGAAPVCASFPFDKDAAPYETRVFSPAPRMRQASSTYAQELHAFHDTLRAVCARKEQSTMNKRRHEHAIPHADDPETRKKHRSSPSRWVWGVSRALDRSA